VHLNGEAGQSVSPFFCLNFGEFCRKSLVFAVSNVTIELPKPTGGSMPTPKSPTSTEKKPSTRKAPARKTTAKVEAAPVAENHLEKHIASYEEIARLAEQYWVERGSPFGSPEVDWLRAESTLQAA
jgi:hypothetical protein